MGFTINHSKLTKIIPRKNNGCKALNITSILSSGVWEGKRCFLLGGGPSLIGFDYNLIKDELTIGVNKTFIQFSATINYVMDARFYGMVTNPSNKENLYQSWATYKGIKVFLKRNKKFKFDSSVYVVNALPNKSISFDLDKGIWPGNNSGFGALSLAIALGCKNIGLLGYDLSVDSKTKKTHWHGGYLDQNPKSMPKKLDKFKVPFNEFSEAFVQQGIKITNLNFDSALKCFSFGKIKEFLALKV